MFVTCTIRSIQDQLSQQGIVVSYRKIISLRPFFITFATEKEIAHCLCKLCLNTRMLFEPLIAQAKRDGDRTTESITEFFMCSCTCPKGQNGYYHWKCVSCKCKECKNKNPMSLTCQMSHEITKVSPFELTQKLYPKINEDGEVVEKISKRTEQVEHTMTYSEIYKKLISLKKVYTTHKYQVSNDQFHWSKILATANDIGEIYHMDYPENLSQKFKFKP